MTALKAAIEKLPDDQKAELASWLASIEHEVWGAQITRDFSAGGAGKDLLKEVDEQIREGSFKPLEQRYSIDRAPQFFDLLPGPT